MLGGESRDVRALADRLGLVVANDNAPGQLVLSGPVDALDAAEEVARDETGARARRLDVSGAFHSPLMEPAADRLRAALGRTPVTAMQIPVYSQRQRRALRRRPRASSPRTSCAPCAGARRCWPCAPPASSASSSSAPAPCSPASSSGRWRRRDGGDRQRAARPPRVRAQHAPAPHRAAQRRRGLHGRASSASAPRCPSTSSRTHDLVERLDTSDEWIVRRTGIRERRVLARRRSRCSELAAARLRAGARRRRPRRPPRSTRSSSRRSRPTASRRASRPYVALALGAERASAVDVNAACAGFLYALDQAAALDRVRPRARRARLRRRGAVAHHRPRRPRHRRALRRRRRRGRRRGRRARARLRRLRARHRRRAGRPALRRARRARSCAWRAARSTATRSRRMVEATARGARPRRADRRRRRPLRRPPGQRPHHRRPPATSSGCRPRSVMVNIDRVANTSSASIPLALAEAERDGRLQPGRDRRAGRLRRGLRLGRGRRGLEGARACLRLTGGCASSRAARAASARRSPSACAPTAGTSRRCRAQRRRRAGRRRRHASRSSPRSSRCASASAPSSCSSTTPACARTASRSACPPTTGTRVVDATSTAPSTARSRALDDMLKARWGRIVNVSSVVAERGEPGPGELRRRQGRAARLHAHGRARDGPQGHHLQRGDARRHRDRHDRRRRRRPRRRRSRPAGSGGPTRSPPPSRSSSPTRRRTSTEPRWPSTAGSAHDDFND